MTSLLVFSILLRLYISTIFSLERVGTALSHIMTYQLHIESQLRELSCQESIKADLIKDPRAKNFICN